MKYRYLSIFLILLILSIGAVSAQDDAAADDNVAVVQDEEVLSASEFVIDDSNYDTYFDNSGLILENSNISDGDTIKLGNVSDKDFVIDKQLTITSNSSSDVLTNVSFYLLDGSDNSEICNLNIVGDGIEKTSISVQSAENVTIHDNVIDIVGLENSYDFYAIYAYYADNLNVQANVITYDGKSDGTSKTFAIAVSQSSDVVISENKIDAKLVSTPIDWVGFVPNAYSEVINFNDCEGLELSYNEIDMEYSNYTGDYDSIYTVELSGCNDAVIEGNFILGFGHSYIYGLVIRGQDFTVSNNGIYMISDENYTNGIDIASDSTGIVENNGIFVSSPFVVYGIYGEMGAEDSPTVDYLNNYVEADSHVVYAMYIYGNEGTIEGNEIMATGNYTAGIVSMMIDDVAVIKNNEITVKGLKNDTVKTEDSVPAQTVGIIAMHECEITNNVVTSAGNYTIVHTGYGSEITGNYLVSSELLGDDSVDDKSEEAVVENNIPIEDARNYNVTNDTFFLFFTEYGLLRDGINPETLTFIGEFSEKTSWNEIDRPITLIGDNATLNDMSFEISSDGVVIDGFNFIADGIYEIITVNGADDVSVINSNFTVAGADDDNNYVVRISNSSNVLIANNTIDYSVITTYNPYTNHVICAEGSDHLLILSNEITAFMPSRPMDWATGTVYSEAVHINDCEDVTFYGNVIDVTSNNQIGSYATLYVVEIRASDVEVAENNITLVNAQYGYALVMSGEDLNIEANDIYVSDLQPYACGINIESNSEAEITGNFIVMSGDSAYGIYTADWTGDVVASIEDNAILIEGNTIFGMSLSGSEATVEDNIIIAIGNYTTGIASAVDQIDILDNKINVKGSNVGIPLGYDSMGIETTGIHIARGNATVSHNVVTTTGDYAVHAEGNGSVTYNNLVASELVGDDSVNATDMTLVENNIPIANATNYNLTNDTFYIFFDKFGYLYDDITPESLTFIGEFSNLVDVIQIDRPIYLLSDNATLNNMIVYIISDNVSVDGFTFIGANSGIYIHKADNVNISNSEFDIDGYDDSQNLVILIEGSNNVSIENNTILFNVETSGTYQNIVIDAMNSDDLTLANNNISANMPARSIDWGTGTVYSDAVRLYDCDDALIDDNLIRVKSNGYISTYDTIYALNINGDNAIVRKNAISVLDAPYGYAVVISGEDFLIEGNIILAVRNLSYACGIEVDGVSNGVINDNAIITIADSSYGIYTANWNGDVKANITNNDMFSIGNSVFALSLSGSKILVEGNDILASGVFTTAIASKVDEITINNNKIASSGSNNGTPLGYDSFGIYSRAIYIDAGNATITSNDINATVSGIFALGDNTLICNNTINVEDTGVSQNNGLDGSCALYIGSDSEICDNVITYVGKTNGTYQNAIIYAIYSEIKVHDNVINGSLVSCPVDWKTKGMDYYPVLTSQGLFFSGCDGLELIDNEIKVEYNNATALVDTIYVVNVFDCDDALIENNILNGLGHSYIYGVVLRGENFTVADNVIDMASDENYTNGIDIASNSTGIVENNKIFVSSPFVVYGIYGEMGFEDWPTVDYLNNYVEADSHAVYAMNIYGNEGTIEGNEIMATGNYTAGIVSRMMYDVAVITNNEITVNGLKNDSEYVGDMVPAQTVGILTMSESQIHNNVITSTGIYSIINSASGSEITYNYLVSSELLGDDSVDDTMDESLVENNIPNTENEYNLTNDTFFLFFNEDGYLRSNITGDLTFIGEFSDLLEEIIIVRPVNLLSDNATLRNMSIIIGIENVTVDGFTLTDEYGGIATFADNATIVNNEFYVNGFDDKENVAIEIYESDDVSILNNRIYFNVETNGTFKNRAIDAKNSNGLIISNNFIDAYMPSRSIDWATGTVYSAGILLDGCDDVVLQNNTVAVKSNDEIDVYDTIYAVSVSGDNVSVIGNDISVEGAPYGYALVVTGDDFIIDDNTLVAGENEAYACGIDIESNSNGIIEKNTITVEGDSAYGIYTANWAGDVKANITNNTIVAKGITAFAMSLSGSEANVENNGILMYGNFTTGIASKFDMIFITNNNIVALGTNEGTPAGYDSMGPETTGVHIVTGDALVKDNTITSNSKYAVDMDSTGAVTDNELVTPLLTGDFAVDYTQGSGVLVANNTPAMELNNTLTNDTFYVYFDKEGKIREQIKADNLTFIGEFSNLVDVITIDRPIALLSDNATLKDITIDITADNVSVDGFTFESDILFNVIAIDKADDVTISNSEFYVTGCADGNNVVIAVDNSENALIINNKIYFDADINGTYSNSVIYAFESDNLAISSNEIYATLPARSINWTTGQVYSTGVEIDGCDNAVLHNNIIGIRATDKISNYDTIYAVSVKGDNASVITNEIAVFEAPYGYAIVLSGEDFIIDGNELTAGYNEAYACGIEVDGKSSGIINDNEIFVKGDSVYGIYTANWAGDVKANITNNNIETDGITSFGMSLSASEVLVENNTISSNGNFTTGIASKVANITINNNTIADNASDEGTPAGYDSMGIETTGIHIVSGNATVTNNDVKTNGEFAVDAKGTGSVTDNTLFAKEYTGDAAVDYDPADTIVSNNTPAMTRAVIHAQDIVMYYKNGTRYVVILTDQNGKPLANMNLTLVINGASYTRTTDENGTASIALNLNSGNYTASASFIGVDPYSDASVENNVTILSTVFGEDVVKVFRNATQYYATFLDAQGNPLAEGTEVTFNINGVMYKRYVNGTEGKAKLNINLPQGEYIITAINPVNGEMAANNITVLASITDNKDLVKYYKNDSQYVVTIIGDDGNPVGAGVNVTFNINGVFYTRQTNESGQAKLNINLQPGDYIITAEYNECRVSNNITVKPILFAQDLVKKYGTSDQFRALLLDGQGNPYPGQNVTFNIHGVFYERTTNSDGYAALNIKLGAAVDEYIITSSFNGTSISNKIIVEP